MKILSEVMLAWVPSRGKVDLLWEYEYNSLDHDDTALHNFEIEEMSPWIRHSKVNLWDEAGEDCAESKSTYHRFVESFGDLWNKPDEAIAKFAQRWGMLGYYTDLYVTQVLRDKKSGRETEQFLEPTSMWRSESAVSRFLLTIGALTEVPSGKPAEGVVDASVEYRSADTNETWQAYCSRLVSLTRVLAQHINHSYSNHTTEIRDWPWIFEAALHGQHDLAYLEFKAGRAQDFLRSTLADFAQELLNSRYLGLQFDVDRTEGSSRTRIGLVATTLLGSIYAAVLNEVLLDEDEPINRTCARPNCGRMLPTETPKGRKTSERRRFCSDACQKFMRRKQLRIEAEWTA
ncbi:MAG TPA: hypothetical protein VG944_11475 [Fimbriimonas sp.]|nr:hypothetical protein [Fimbriimonas sp.]